MEEENLISKYDQEMKEDFDKGKKIAVLLNEFGAISLKQSYTPLEISEKDSLVLFELLISKFNMIKEILEEYYRYTNEH